MHSTPLLTPLQQFDLLLPEQGRRCLFAASNKSNTFYNTNEELAAAVQARRNKTGIYMAMCGFDDSGFREQVNAQWIRSLYIDIDAGPEKYAKHGDKVYRTIEEALAALSAFCKSLGMKPSLIVSSGMGLHAYWRLDQDYTTAEVYPQMLRLKEACKALGLRADPAPTADTARVLRPIGGLHSVDEHGVERRVQALKLIDVQYTLDDVSQMLLPYIPPQSKTKAKAQDREPSINDDVLGFPESNNSLAKGLKHCAALAEVKAAGGRVPEPHWRLMIGVAKHCNVDGAEVAHEISSDDSRYDQGTTDDYLARWNVGPSTCASFADHTDACKACPHNGKITSPIMLCRVDVTPPATDQEPKLVESADALVRGLEASRPDLFTAPEGPGWYYRKNTRDNTWRLCARAIEEVPDKSDPSGRATVKMLVDRVVAYRLFWIASCTLGENDGDEAQTELIVVTSPNNPKQERFFINASFLSDNNGFSKQLHARGAIITSERNATQSVRNFLIEEYIKVQLNMKYTVRSHYGYEFFEGEMLCAHGDLLLRKQGDKVVYERTAVNSRLSGPLLQLLNVGCLPPSDSGKWDASVLHSHILPAAQQYAAFVRSHFGDANHRPFRFALALGLASTYLVFTDAGKLVPGGQVPAAGGVVALLGDTGKGKTSLQKLLSAAHCAGGAVVGGDKYMATQLGRSGIASGLAYYPLILDEVSQNEDERAASEVQMLANGQARLRSTRNGSLSQGTSNWHLITMMSSNTSLVSAMMNAPNPAAMLARLIEIDFDTVDTSVRVSSSEYEADANPVFKNGGAIGLLLDYAAVLNGPEKMGVAANTLQRKIEELHGLKSESRYYARMAAAAFLAVRVLKVLGVEMFDEAELKEDFARAVDQLQTNLNLGAVKPDEVFAQMVGDFSRNIVVTKDYPVQGGGGAGVPVLNQGALQMPLIGRQVNNDQLVYLSCMEVNRWLTKKRIPTDKFLKHMQKAGRLITNRNGDAHVRKSMTSGVNGLPNVPRIRCYAFRITDTAALYLAKDGAPTVYDDVEAKQA